MQTRHRPNRNVFIITLTPRSAAVTDREQQLKGGNSLTPKALHSAVVHAQWDAFLS